MQLYGCLPYYLILDARLLSAALAIVEEVPSGEIFLGFNSLGAFASVNHGHFHGMVTDPGLTLPIERAAKRAIAVRPNQVRIAQLWSYPAAALLFSSEGLSLLEIAQAAEGFINILQRENVPPIAVVRRRAVFIGASSRLKPPKLAGAIASIELGGRLHAHGEHFSSFTELDAHEQLAYGTVSRECFDQFTAQYIATLVC